MEDILDKDKIIRFMSKAPYPMGVSELCRRMDVPKSERDSFKGLLKRLEAEGEIILIKGGRYGLPERMNLAAMRPRNTLASTQFCLANPGQEYLVYLPDGGEATVDLTVAPGTFAVEWMHPVDGTLTLGEAVPGGDRRAFKAPFSGDAVLHIRKQ